MPEPTPDPALTALVAEIEAQERELVLPGFSNDDAWRLGCLLVETARERGLGVTVDVRRGQQQLFHAALEGTSADNDRWVDRKVALVQRTGTSSYLVGRRLALRGGRLEDAGLSPLEFAPHGGSFPVTVRGVGVVGTVTVSGLPQADDHALVVECLRAFVARD